MIDKNTLLQKLNDSFIIEYFKYNEEVKEKTMVSMEVDDGVLHIKENLTSNGAEINSKSIEDFEDRDDILDEIVSTLNNTKYSMC